MKAGERGAGYTLGPYNKSWYTPVKGCSYSCCPLKVRKCCVAFRVSEMWASRHLFCVQGVPVVAAGVSSPGCVFSVQVSFSGKMRSEFR